MNIATMMLTGMILLCDNEVFSEQDNYIEIGNVNTAVEALTMEVIYEVNGMYLQDDGELWSGVSEDAIQILGNSVYPYEQLLVDGNGYPDYECRKCEDGESADGPEYLKHIFTEKTIYLTEPRESLDTYLEETSVVSKDIRTKKSMIEASYNQEQYGGIFYDKSRQMVGVYVCDDTVMGELRDQGIYCIKTEDSLDILQQKLCQLWEKRLELGINYIDINECYNCLDIYVADKTLVENYLKMQNITCGQVIQKMVLHPGNLENAMDLGITNADEPLCTYSIFQSETRRTDVNIKEGLKKLKAEYPDYECRNLVLRITGDAKYERYLNFEEKLLEFVETLSDYEPNKQNPAEEMLFGDPERIELKSQLREYKLLYPEKSYEEIYEEYLSDWETYQDENREVKLYKLAINRAVGELSNVETAHGNSEERLTQGEEMQAEKDSRIAVYVIMAGVLILVLRILVSVKRSEAGN